MKKTCAFLVIFLFFWACSPRKNTFVSRQYQGFTTYYNTLFNSKDALETEIKNRNEAFEDNFNGPFIPILKTEAEADELLLSTQPLSPPNQNSQGATILEISEAKALKAIADHSMEFDGVQKNKEIFEAHLLLAKARMFQGKNLQALDALNYIFANMPNDKRIDLAKVYEGRIYTLLGDFSHAQQIFSDLESQPKIKKKYNKLLHIYSAELLLKLDEKEQAIDELEDAFALNKNSEIRSRIAYLRGQVLSSLGRNEEARESFITAHKYAKDFEFEVKSQLEIAKSYNPEEGNYEALKDYLEKNSKKGIYNSRKNELYYALGLLAKKEGKQEEANEYFQKSLREELSDPQIRGLVYYEIGQEYYNKSDYLAAGVYYDSAITSMNYQPKVEELKTLSANIKKLSANYYLIQKNDSILALTKMSEAQLNEYFGKYIADLQEKERKQELEREKEAREKGFQTAEFSLGSNPSNSGFGNPFGSAQKGSRFYFDNETTTAKGVSDFKQIWGDRALADNWRYSASSASIEDLKNEAMGKQDVQNPRRFEVAYYTEQIPKDADVLDALKKSRDTAQLGLGIMYYEFFDNRPLANETLFSLIDLQPEEDTEIQALYTLFYINYPDYMDEAGRAKNLILNKYPYSPYAEFVKNPQSNSFTSSSEEIIELYKKAFDLYSEEK